MVCCLIPRRGRNMTAGKWNLTEILVSQDSKIWDKMHTLIWEAMEAPQNSSSMEPIWAVQVSILVKFSPCSLVKEAMASRDSALAFQEWEVDPTGVHLDNLEVVTIEEAHNQNSADFKASQVLEVLATSVDSIKRTAISIFHDDMLLSFILMLIYQILCLPFSRIQFCGHR